MEAEHNLEEIEEGDASNMGSLVLLKSLTKRIMKGAIEHSYHVNASTVTLMDKLASSFLINLGIMYRN